jgi:hypothetical protein
MSTMGAAEGARSKYPPPPWLFLEEAPGGDASTWPRCDFPSADGADPLSAPPCLAPLFQEVAANDEDDPRDPPLVVGAGDDICLSDEAVDDGPIVNAALAAMFTVFVVDKLDFIHKKCPFHTSPTLVGCRKHGRKKVGTRDWSKFDQANLTRPREPAD